MTDKMNKQTAFSVLDGKQCCRCLTALTKENIPRLTSADWCMDYDAMPCNDCWAVKEVEEKTDENAPKWTGEMMAVWDEVLKYEKEYRVKTEEKTAEDKEVKVWWFKSDNRNIQVTKVVPKWETYKRMVRCEMVEQHCVQTDKHTRFRIWMNELGLYEREAPNWAAEKVLKKVSLNWGSGVLTGNYVVTKETLDEAWWDEEKVTDEMWEADTQMGWRYVDMDITDISKWIADINETIKKSVIERNKWLKQMKDEGTPVTVLNFP